MSIITNNKKVIGHHLQRPYLPTFFSSFLKSSLDVKGGFKHGGVVTIGAGASCTRLESDVTDKPPTTALLCKQSTTGMVQVVK